MLTASRVESLIRKGKRCTESDVGERGEGKLVLSVTPKKKGGASAHWFFQYFMDGKKRMKLGSAGPNGLTLKKAREEFEVASSDYQAGNDPKKERDRRIYEKRLHDAEESKFGTVCDLFESYLEGMKADGKDSWSKVKGALTEGKYAAVNDFPKDVLAKDVTSKMIAQVISHPYKRGSKSMADHLRSYISAAFSFGIRYDNDYRHMDRDIRFGIDRNPTSDVYIDNTAKRVGKRFLTKDEISKFWNEALGNGVEERVLCSIRLIISMGGARIKEVVHSLKSEYDLEEGVFNLPDARTKNKKDHPLPLSERSVHLIEEAVRLDPVGSPYLFPSCKKTKTMKQSIDFTSLNTAIHRVCENIDMDAWTPRDIRRTVRTHLADHLNEGLLNTYLNHGRTGVGDKHYNRSKMLARKRVVMKKWAAFLDEVLEGDAK